MMRSTPVSMLAPWLVGLPLLWTASGGGPSHCPDCRRGTDLRPDPTCLRLLRDKGVRERLGLSAGQEIEIGRRLALTLDPDQEDLLRMIMGQFHADRDRLRELEDPGFDDDEEGSGYERPRLRAMAEGFPGRTSAMIDRVLTTVQRAAIAARRGSTDPDALAGSLNALRQDSWNGIRAALAPGQWEQLSQIAVDTEGPLAAVRPEVAVRLKLSDEQQSQVRAIRDAARNDLDRLRDPSPVSPAYREGDDLDVRMRPRLSTIRKESARILSVACGKIGKMLHMPPTRQDPSAPGSSVNGSLLPD